jgi:type VI secretion system Hcp family effector
MKHLLPEFALLILILATAPVGAAEYYLEIGGIEGGSTEPGREDETEVESFSWDTNRTCSPQGVATYGTFYIRKQLDKATPKLAKALSSGLIITDMVLEAEALSQVGEKVTVMQYKFRNSLVTDFDPKGDADNTLPQESVGFCAQGMRISYLRYNNNGVLVEVITEGFQLVDGGSVPPPDDFPGNNVRIVDTLTITGPSGKPVTTTTVTEPK